MSPLVLVCVRLCHCESFGFSVCVRLCHCESFGFSVCEAVLVWVIWFQCV